MPRYLIKPGDHCSSVAERFGFSDFQTIWQRPENAGLRKLRNNPHVLNPGDELFVPSKEDCPEFSAATDLNHRYVLKRPPLYLRIETSGLVGRKIANTACELHIGQSVLKLKTDGNGLAYAKIPPSAQEATFIIEGMARRLKIGHLDPVDQTTGQRERLRNLGYYNVSVEEEDDSAELEAAVLQFQIDQSLNATGDCDSATQQKLLSVHGC